MVFLHTNFCEDFKLGLRGKLKSFSADTKTLHTQCWNTLKWTRLKSICTCGVQHWSYIQEPTEIFCLPTVCDFFLILSNISTNKKWYHIANTNGSIYWKLCILYPILFNVIRALLSTEHLPGYYNFSATIKMVWF